MDPKKYFVRLVVEIWIADAEPSQGVPHVVELGLEQARKIGRPDAICE
jgi:hypothetical protein